MCDVPMVGGYDVPIPGSQPISGMVTRITKMRFPLDRLRKNLHMMNRSGAVAQLGERVVRNDEVVGSIPIGSTNTHRDIRIAPTRWIRIALAASWNRHGAAPHQCFRHQGRHRASRGGLRINAIT